MNGLSSRIYRGGILAVLVAGAACFCAGRVTGPPAVEREEWRAGELDTGQVTLLDRVARKEHIVAELIAGRLTLREAAREFRAAHGSGPIVFHPSVVVAFRQNYEDAADEVEALLCLDVIGRVHGVLEDRSGDAAGVSERLERELQLIITRRPREPLH